MEALPTFYGDRLQSEQRGLLVNFKSFEMMCLKLINRRSRLVVRSFLRTAQLPGTLGNVRCTLCTPTRIVGAVLNSKLYKSKLIAFDFGSLDFSNRTVFYRLQPASLPQKSLGVLR